MARMLLAALDPDSKAQWGFRTFADGNDDPRLAIKCCGTLDGGVRQSANPAKNKKPCQPSRLLAFMNGLGAGVFFTPNRLDGAGQSAANVVAVRALFVDADSRPEVDRLHAFVTASALQPTAIVASGGLHDGVEKLQAYWRIDGCNLDQFSHAQRTLISRVGSDPAVNDLARVMRVPGFYHRKREPRMTRLISVDASKVYDFALFIDRVQRLPAIGGTSTGQPHVGNREPTTGPVGPPVPAPYGRSSINARLRELMHQHGDLVVPAVGRLLLEAVGPVDGPGNRHATLVSVVAKLNSRGWSDDEISGWVLPRINEKWADGDWGEHLSRVVRWTRERTNARGVALGRLFGGGQ
jgi:hypothetical protein